MKRLIAVQGLLLAVVFHSAAQKIDSALNVLATRFPQEKIYIHYDKDNYVAGETIWFKAYLYSNGSPSGISNNFYLQFTDGYGKIISSKKYPVMGAVAKGNIDIPDSLPQGNYYIRALTPNMLNFDEAFIYKKNIFVFKPTATQTKETVPAPQNISLKFFPESGNLVDGLLTVVAFKAVDQWGIPVDVSGIIKSDEGATVAPFKSVHDGIGKIQFRPQTGKKYWAEIEVSGIKKLYSLPEVQPSGINLKVQDEKGGKLFQLVRSEKEKEQFETLLLVVEMNNRVVYENEITFENYPSIKGHLVTDSLPSGILHFTVFNKMGIPLAERLSFVNNREYVTNVAVEIVKPGTEKRIENILELTFPDSVQRSCSVSVTDASGIGHDNNDNICSRFLLTGDLKGYVHNPAYYFVHTDSFGEKQNDSTRQALDNLMLTHGWSRFSWTKILANDFPVKKYSDRPLISISGLVNDEKDKEPVTGGKLNIYLEAEDSATQNYEVGVDAKGRFKMDSLVFLGKTKFYYVYSNIQDKPRPAHIHIDENITERIIEMTPANVTENNIAKNFTVAQNDEEVSQRYQYVKARFNEMKELERVILQSKINKKPADIVNEKYTTGVFRSMGKVNLDNINEPGNDKSLNVVDYIKNSIQQVEIQGGRFVNRKNFSLINGQKWAVDIFLNGAPANILELRVLRVDQIALIKFYEAGFVGVGSGAPGGAIAVYTKEVSNDDMKIDKLDYVVYNGYSITKEFYNPDYKIKDIKHDFSDNRTTLYWNPDVYTNTETKSFKLNFFNNDFSKKFRIVVEGFDASGKLIHLEKIVGN